MTYVTRFAAAAALVLSPLVAFTQQQFGPSPQAMYKQHPGSAPTYVSYGAPTASAPGVQASPVNVPAAVVPTRRTATSTQHRAAAHRATTAAKGTTGKGTSGR